MIRTPAVAPRPRRRRNRPAAHHRARHDRGPARGGGHRCQRALPARRELVAAVDGAALAGAQAVDEESVYRDGLPASGPVPLNVACGRTGGPRLPGGRRRAGSEDRRDDHRVGHDGDCGTGHTRRPAGGEHRDGGVIRNRPRVRIGDRADRGHTLSVGCSADDTAASTRAVSPATTTYSMLRRRLTVPTLCPSRVVDADLRADVPLAVVREQSDVLVAGLAEPRHELLSCHPRLVVVADDHDVGVRPRR